MKHPLFLILLAVFAAPALAHAAGYDAPIRPVIIEGAPAPEGRFADLAMLAPVKDYPPRHVSTMLAFEATAEACRIALQRDTERTSRADLMGFYSIMWVVPAVALASGLFLAAAHPVQFSLALPILGLWLAAPWIAWRISQPTLVISGDDDPIVPAANSRLLVLASDAYHIAVARPDECVSAALDLISETKAKA